MRPPLAACSVTEVDPLDQLPVEVMADPRRASSSSSSKSSAAGSASTNAIVRRQRHSTQRSRSSTTSWRGSWNFVSVSKPGSMTARSTEDVVDQGGSERTWRLDPSLSSPEHPPALAGRRFGSSLQRGFDVALMAADEPGWKPRSRKSNAAGSEAWPCRSTSPTLDDVDAGRGAGRGRARPDRRVGERRHDDRVRAA